MLAFVLLFTLAQTDSPSAQFERGKTVYERGEYAKAIEILRPLLYPEIRLVSEGEVVQAHRMLGVAHLFERQNAQAAQELRKLLQLRPDYRFDALLDPPQVVDFFNGVLRDYEDELAQIAARRKEEERQAQREREALERARNGPTIVEKRFARNSFAINFIPFGAGQFQNGHRGKGWAFLLGETALGALSVGALATNFALHGVRPRVACTNPPGTAGCTPNRTQENRSRLLTRLQVTSGGLFFAVVAWGIADAIYHFQPEVPLGTGNGRAAGQVSAARVTPLVWSQGGGAGLAFRF